jgi:copper(I)-binding protein
MKVRMIYGFIPGLLLLAFLGGCAKAAAPSITVESAWGMPSKTMPTAGGLFMLIKNSGDAPDKLLSGSSPACGSIEVHEMVAKSDGTMGMNLLDKPLEIPAAGQVELKSGSIHIMCIMKKDELFKPGTKIDLTLKFEKSGVKTFPVDLRMQ